MSREKFIALRKEYSRFVYESYSWMETPQGIAVKFVFKVYDFDGNEKLLFEPSAVISLPTSLFNSSVFTARKPLIDLLVFNCGMVEMVSYWKATCSPITQVVCGVLTKEMQAWWKRLYFNGLGEFFYLNGIDTDEEWFMRLQNPIGKEWLLNGGEDVVKKLRNEATAKEETVSAENNITVLVPVGGGKDSCVTLELLKKECETPQSEPDVFKIFPFIINPRGATEKCCERAGFSYEQIVVMYREIDPLLLELNKRDFLNGHTPFSAMLAFYSTLAATLAGANYIALSNESSANEATVVTDSFQANHQYSKSFEFEQDFRNYVKNFISPVASVAEYFSLLRPLSEIKIAENFSQYPQYFDVFKSCNVGSKTDSWCGHCAKCLFVYIILAPFLKPDVLQKIFSNGADKGKNLLDDISLLPLLKELVGESETKPFECVGTRSEINWALQQIIERGEHGGVLLDEYKKLSVYNTKIPTELVMARNNNHAVPSNFATFL